MTSSLAFLAGLAPVLFLIPDLLAPSSPGMRPARLIRQSIALAMAGLAISLAGLLAAFVFGPVTSPLIGLYGFGLSIRVDVLSMVMASLVSFMGLIVMAYSKNYLDGDPRQAHFYGALGTTIALVLLLVLAGNLFQLVVAFVTMSLAFNRLLMFYGDRPAAQLVARKKFIVARFADASLIMACGLLVHAYGTADIDRIIELAKSGTMTEANGQASVAAILMAIAAMQKSAQFPFHFWLPEVMETPTPVSALLHAGIINAGGFLVLRLADVMVLSPLALHSLAVVGGLTALLAGLVMITQTTAKGSLAWSTIAQMGFMLFQCGLGLFAIALLHIVAHSLYKAHAFLSAGSVVAKAKAEAASEPLAPARPGRIALAFTLAAILYGGIGLAFGLTPDKEPAILTMGAILVMGVTHLLATGLAGKRDRLRMVSAIGMTAAVVLAYFTLQALAGLVFGPSLPATPAADADSYAIMAIAIIGFGASTLVQIIGFGRLDHPAFRWQWVHASNGFYINHHVNRWLAARPATASTSTAL